MRPLTFVAALLGALFIQVGTNLSNDYSDARRGADTEDRLGPVRVTAGGLVPPRQVLVATYVAFALAVLAGSYLIATAGWELLLVGAASILAGVLYTGGPRPYGYEGLGEVFVFLFFGVVAVTGSYFAQVEALEWEALVLAVPVGLLASAILVVNNVRDLETDRRAGKRTLAVRLGRERTRVLYVAMVAGAFVTRAAPVAAGLAVAVAAARAARRPAGAAGGADGAHPLGRPGAQRRAGRDGAAAARLLPPALGGHPGELMPTAAAADRGAPMGRLLRSASRCAPRGACSTRARAAARAARGRRRPGRPRRGGAARALRRRAARRGAGGARRLRPRGGRARGGRSCWRPAAPSATSRRRSPRSTSRSGTSRASAPGGSVAQLISVEAARSIPVNATVGAEDRAGAAAAAAAAAQAEFDTVKVKVGVGDDAGRLAAVRAAVGPRVAIRVDANGAWGVEQAVASLRALAPAGLELAEEPVHGVAALRAVRAEVDVPLAMDETAAQDGAPGSGATDAVCLKIARCGGISGVLRDAAAARVAGSVVYLASSFDGPLGIAAAVHAAAGLTAGGPLPAHGLATLAAFAEPGERLHAVRGAIRVPREPGLGVA